MTPIPSHYIKKNFNKFDDIFCMMAKKYGLKKLMLKALAIQESGLDPTASRFEQKFWNTYLKDNDEWKDEDQSVVASSWGLCQLMYVVAVELGFKKGRTAEELCDPVINIELAAKYLRKWLDSIYKYKICDKNFDLLPIEICLARFNAGAGNNPNDEGKLRNPKYVEKVMKIWQELKKEEKECDDE